MTGRQRGAGPALVGTLLAVLAVTAPASAATIDVNTTADVVANDGQCSLREAINVANLSGNSGGAAGECVGNVGLPSQPDEIQLDAGTYAIQIAGAREEANATGDFDPIETGGPLTIDGAGQSQTIIFGNGLDRVLDFKSTTTTGVPQALEDLTITGGEAPDGVDGSATFTERFGGDGGGINSNEPLTLTNVLIHGNSAGDGGNAPGGGDVFTELAFAGGSGGGIFINNALTLVNSTVRDNFAGDSGTSPTPAFDNATGGTGGGVATQSGSPPGVSDVQITNSTISGNEAGDALGANGSGGFGGGITHSGSNGSLTITNSTIHDNSSGNGTLPGNGGGIFSSQRPLTVASSTITANTAATGNGGGIQAEFAGAVTIENSVIAENTAADKADVSNTGRPAATSFSLIGDADDAVITDNGGNQLGSTASPLSPQLGALAGNGGPTRTRAPLSGSPVIDAGSTALATDQRGEPRPVDQPGTANAADGDDIGAVELALPAPPAPDPSPDPNPNPNPNPDPTPADTTAPVLTLATDSPLELRKAPKKLLVDVTTNEACAAALTATIKVPEPDGDGKERFGFDSAAASLPVGTSELALKAPKPLRSALTVALKGGEGAKAKITGTCTDAAGNAGTAKTKTKFVPEENR